MFQESWLQCMKASAKHEDNRLCLNVCLCYRYTEGEAFISKILKDKQKLRKASQKREKQEEEFRRRNAEESDDNEEAEEVAAKKARFEESKADLQRKIKAQAGPPAFKQALYPTEVNLPASLCLA